MQNQQNNQPSQLFSAVAAGPNSQSLNLSYRVSGSGSGQHTIFVPPQQVNNIYPTTAPSSAVQRHETTNYYVQQQQPQLTQSGNIRVIPAATITPPTSTTITMIPQQQQQQQRNRKLQVDDALSYLERVRQQFAQTPEKYNEFLEVMKDFKSHSIDTHGVLVRVTKLFRAYPNLIDGFNTFLPPGFEVHVRGESIHIIEPDGTNQLIKIATGQPVVEPIEASASSGSGALIQQNDVSQNQLYHKQQEHVLTQVKEQTKSDVTHSSNTGHGVVRIPSTTHTPTEQTFEQIPMFVNASTETLRQQQPHHPTKQTKATFLQTSGHLPPLQHQQPHLKQATILSSAAQQQLQHILEIHQQEQQQMMIMQATDVSNYHFQPQKQNQLSMVTPSMVGVGQTQEQQNQLPVQQQPIHFDQALGYLHKIKERFSNKPEVYNQFLAILSNYQRANDSTQKLTESAVYKEVARLFHNEEDLMQDFQSFLPDANLELSNLPSREHFFDSKQLQFELVEKEIYKTGVQISNITAPSSGATTNTASNTTTEVIKSIQTSASRENVPNKKRAAIIVNEENSMAKKSKNQVTITYDKPANEILRDYPLEQFIIFEKIHRALQSESVYENFIRFLFLYTKSILSKNELVEMITPFLASFPELLKEFKDILSGKTEVAQQIRKQVTLEDRFLTEKANHIDFATAQVLGVSYRRLPDSYQQPKRTGRDELCKQVLNDHWVSYPEWIGSEDCDSVTSKKTCFEEVMYRTEEERFEVDMLIEHNSTAINALDYANQKIKSLSAESAQKWMHVNEGFLNCSYTVISRAVKKLYGEYANKILCALRDNPLATIPQVLMRMRNKDAEWRTVREEYNVIWQDQVEKNYLKSLDHQTIAFKANDIKNIRSKSIFNQLQNIYNERCEKADQGFPEETGPHLVIEYPGDRQIFYDANELIIHYVKRLQNWREKKGMFQLLKSIIPQLFMLSLPDDDDQTEDILQVNGLRMNETDYADEQQMEKWPQFRTKRGRPKQSEVVNSNNDANEIKKHCKNVNEIQNKDESTSKENELIQKISGTLHTHQLRYTMFFGTNCWLLFIRLHAILCDRLAIIKKHTDELIKDYNEEVKFRLRQHEVYQKYGNSINFCHPLNAVDVHKGLRELKKPLQNPENFYQIMLQEMKNLLDSTVDITAFEDSMRSMFDIKAYVLFTMDKLVHTITGHLKNCIAENSGRNFIGLFQEYYKKRINDYEQGEVTKQADAEYENAAEKLLVNQCCYKMYFFNHTHPLVTIELIDTDETETDSDDEEQEKKESENVVPLPYWPAFLKNKNCDNSGGEKLKDLQWEKVRLPYLKRNLRYRQTLSEVLRLNCAVNSSVGKEALAGTITKRKIPHFFASNGYCYVLKQEMPLKEIYHSVIYGDAIKYLIHDFMIRKGAPGMFSKKNHRKISLKRRRKCESWLEKRQRGQELSARWLTTGCSTQYCQHPRFKYLKFTKYSSQNS